MKFDPSKYQQAIFDWVKDGEGSGMVNAVAGSGKTTTIVHACKFIPTDKHCAFLAFNKAIADELAKRVPKHVEAKTLNSLGHRAWYSHYGRVNLQADKTKQLCKSHLLGGERRLTGEVIKLVGLCKAFGMAPKSITGVYTGLMGNEYEDYVGLIDQFGIDIKLNDEGTLICLAETILKLSAQQERWIDFDDQLWLPVINQIPVQRYDWLIVDEAQDLSPVQRELLKMSLKDDGRLLAVGDPYQAIYGFRGAGSDSMGQLEQEFQCVEMPLSISYRCPRSVVIKAQEVVPHIESHPKAKEGRVETVSLEYALKAYQPGNMVLCRNAAPLVSLAYELLSKRIPVVMMGRDIGEGLVKLIDRLKPKGIDGDHGLMTKLEVWAAKEIAKAMKKDNEAKAQSIEDKRDSILAFLKGCKAETIPKLRDEITNLFASGGDTENRVILSTIHRAKGLEADRVFVYRMDLMPSKWARQDWMVQQEQNLMYVAYTRAMKELFLVLDEELTHDSKETDRTREERETEAPVCDGPEIISRPDSGEGSGSGTRQRQNVA